MQAAEGNAWSAVNLLGELSGSQPKWPADFLQGVAVEPFLAADGAIRLKPDQMQRAVLTLEAVDPDRRNSIIELIHTGLQSGQIRDRFWFKHQRPEALQALGSAMQQQELERITEIRDALERLDIGDLDE
jgi:hypothetical protein